MEVPSISRFNSQSTSQTLVGSDNGLISPLTGRDRTLPAVPSIHTGPDNKQWIDLEFISPKLLRELRRAYDPSYKDEARHPLVRGAVKVKAWARQSKLGIDIRLRRKISADHDEVTDIRLMPEASVFQDEKFTPKSMSQVETQKLPLVSELPAQNEISELPDNSVIQELPSISERRVQQSSTYIDEAEPLPRYEARQAINTGNPTIGIARVEEHATAEAAHQTPTSHPDSVPSSIVPTPTRGLSVHSPRDVESQETIKPGSTENLPPASPPRMPQPEQEKVKGLEVDLAEANRKLLEEQSSRERFESLLRDVQQELSKHREGEDGTSGPTRFLRGLKVVDSARYETETDIEPPSPSDRRAVRGKKVAGIQKGRKTAASSKAPAKSPSQKMSTREARKPEPSSLIERQPTMPKSTPASAGIEDVWSALLKAQAKIIGPEHPLTYQAKSDLVRSRASHHRSRSASFLGALQETSVLATDLLGDVHPLVTTFAVDLATLDSLLGITSDGRSGRAAVAKVDMAGLIPKQVVQTPDHGTPSNVPEPVIASNIPESLPATDRSKLSLPPLITSHASNESYNQEIVGSSDALFNTWQPPHKARHGPTVLGALILDAIIKPSMSSLVWLQENYGPEQPVEKGKVRVRWTCSCGEQLHDDFTENRQGAARELEAYLNRPRIHTGQTPTSPSSSHGTNSFNGGSSIGGPPSSQTTWSSYSFPSHMSPIRDKDTKPPAAFTTGLPFQTPFTQYPEPPWLLTCANEDRHTPKLAHLDMAPHRIRSDKDLAIVLRDHYFNVNKKWWRTLRLRSLATIEFVQFEVHQNRFADLRKCPDMPPSGSSDYTFEPGDLMPPVGSQYLLHLFKHPEDYDGELITYLRAPKRNGRLQLGVGWGINLVESFSASKVWLLVTSFFALGSLVFAAVWATRRDDVQGAFGVAAWICTLAALVVGWLQATLG